MVEAFEEAAMSQLRVFGHHRRRDDDGCRNSCARKHIDDSVAVLYSEPVAEVGFARQLGQRVPLRIGVCADRDPLSSPSHR